MKIIIETEKELKEALIAAASLFNEMELKDIKARKAFRTEQEDKIIIKPGEYDLIIEKATKELIKLTIQ